MIAITCSQCKQRLEMDDGFAGGVCRCQFCGTIQTVPQKRKLSPTAATDGAMKPQVAGKSAKPSTSKTLYRKGAAPADPGSQSSPGTGLDELAEIVASSGLARGGLAKPGASKSKDSGKSTPANPTARSPMLPWLIAAGAIGAAIGIVVIVLTMRGGGGSQPAPAANSGAAVSSAAKDPALAPTEGANITGPAFAGVKLPAGPIIYLLDRSQANDEILDTVKAAAYQSIRSLGPKAKFQVIFWHHTTDGIFAYPGTGLADATSEQVDAAAKKFEDIVSYGATELKPTVDKAMKSKPAALVIVTAKGFILDDADVNTVQAIVKGTTTKVYAFALGETDSPALQRIAKQTGGEYRTLQYHQLKSAIE